MASPKVKTRNGGKWTEARFNSFVTPTLRSGMRRWQPKWDVLHSALVGKKKNKKSGRLANHYKCAKCGDHYVAKDVQVDHILPIGPHSTWDEFIEALYCESDNLQVLCKSCHTEKTNKEKNENKKGS